MNLFSTQHRPIAINQAVIRANEKTMVQQCHSAGIGPIPPAPAADRHRYDRSKKSVIKLKVKKFLARWLTAACHPVARGRFMARPITAESGHQKALFALVWSV
jgi:hypothetical protein